MKTIKNQGYHKNLKVGEFLIGFFSERWFSQIDYWQTQRHGKGRILSGINKGKRPLFIQIREAIEKGWKIKK